MVLPFSSSLLGVIGLGGLDVSGIFRTPGTFFPIVSADFAVPGYLVPLPSFR